MIDSCSSRWSLALIRLDTTVSFCSKLQRHEVFLFASSYQGNRLSHYSFHDLPNCPVILFLPWFQIDHVIWVRRSLNRILPLPCCPSSHRCLTNDANWFDYGFRCFWVNLPLNNCSSPLCLICLLSLIWIVSVLWMVLKERQTHCFSGSIWLIFSEWFALLICRFSDWSSSHWLVLIPFVSSICLLSNGHSASSICSPRCVWTVVWTLLLPGILSVFGLWVSRWFAIEEHYRFRFRWFGSSGRRCWLVRFVSVCWIQSARAFRQILDLDLFRVI